MKSQFQRLRRGACERCRHNHDLVTVDRNGHKYDLCRGCATKVQAGRPRR